MNLQEAQARTAQALGDAEAFAVEFDRLADRPSALGPVHSVTLRVNSALHLSDAVSHEVHVRLGAVTALEAAARRVLCGLAVRLDTRTGHGAADLALLAALANYGPEVPEPDGTALDEEVGQLVGALLMWAATREIPWPQLLGGALERYAELRADERQARPDVVLAGIRNGSWS